jgi:hypothetical protein
MKIHVVGIAIIALGLTGCAADVKVDKPRDQMSQMEKDSALAASSLPGAGVVKKAMAISAVEQNQQAAMDSAGKEN